MAEIQPKIIGLMNTNLEDGRDLFDFLISNQEEVLLSYKSVRDRLIVTNKKLLVIDVQGITGRKKEYMILPLSKLTAFSCESSGTFDLDAELKVWGSAINQMEFQFLKGTDIRPLVKILNEHLCG
ncbi:PH domain-containing protein [Turicibacter sp. TJ11]|uniref:PH domain-containing protein n=1 Tax=Turicibacter sp. TJ11 TaxID=2806443 RepID=UPI001F3CD07A|nr:PH domain-containing protein [Turicibacter sp. TJ11]